MVQVMDADLEAAVYQVLAQGGRNEVIPRNEIEGGAGTKALFYIRELHAFFEAIGGFNIVGKHKGKLFSIRPGGELRESGPCQESGDTILISGEIRSCPQIPWSYRPIPSGLPAF